MVRPANTPKPLDCDKLCHTRGASVITPVVMTQAGRASTVTNVVMTEAELWRVHTRPATAVRSAPGI